MKTTSLFEDILKMRSVGAGDSAVMSKIRTFLTTLGYECVSEKPLEYFGIIFGNSESNWIGITVLNNSVEMTFKGEFWSFDIYTENWLNKIKEIIRHES